MQQNSNELEQESTLDHELTEADLAGIYGGNGDGTDIYDLTSLGDIVDFLGG